jgi:N-acetylneuraminate epimerase
VLYIVGGQETPDSQTTSDTAWTIDLSSPAPRWRKLAPCPGGGRMLAVAASFGGAFWLAGGVDLVVGDDGKIGRRYLKDAYRHDPRDGWRRIADLPNPLAAGPTPAPTDATGFLILGGDDGSQVGVAPEAHRGFSKIILHYDSTSDHWTEAGALPAPRVTVPCVIWNKAWVVPSGEARPGVRSPEVWAATPEPKD